MSHSQYPMPAPMTDANAGPSTININMNNIQHPAPVAAAPTVALSPMDVIQLEQLAFYSAVDLFNNMTEEERDYTRDARVKLLSPENIQTFHEHQQDPLLIWLFHVAKVWRRERAQQGDPIAWQQHQQWIKNGDVVRLVIPATSREHADLEQAVNERIPIWPPPPQDPSQDGEALVVLCSRSFQYLQLQQQEKHCQQCLSEAHATAACTFEYQRATELQARAMLSNGKLLELADSQGRICRAHRERIDEMIRQDPQRQGGPLPPRMPFSFTTFDATILDETALLPMCDGCQAESGLEEGGDIDTCVCATNIVNDSCMLCEVGRITPAKELAVKKRTSIDASGHLSVACACGKPVCKTKDVASKCIGCDGVVTAPYSNVKGNACSFVPGTVHMQGHQHLQAPTAAGPASNAPQADQTVSGATAPSGGSRPCNDESAFGQDEINSPGSFRIDGAADPKGFAQGSLGLNNWADNVGVGESGFRSDTWSQGYSQPDTQFDNNVPKPARRKRREFPAFTPEEASSFADMGYAVNTHLNGFGTRVGLEQRVEYWIEDNLQKSIRENSLARGLQLCGHDEKTANSIANEVIRVAATSKPELSVVLRIMRRKGHLSNGKRKAQDEPLDETWMGDASPSTKRPRLEGPTSQWIHEGSGPSDYLHTPEGSNSLAGPSGETTSKRKRIDEDAAAEISSSHEVDAGPSAKRTKLQEFVSQQISDNFTFSGYPRTTITQNKFLEPGDFGGYGQHRLNNDTSRGVKRNIAEPTHSNNGSGKRKDRDDNDTADRPESAKRIKPLGFLPKLLTPGDLNLPVESKPSSEPSGAALIADLDEWLESEDFRATYAVEIEAGGDDVQAATPPVNPQHAGGELSTDELTTSETSEGELPTGELSKDEPPKSKLPDDELPSSELSRVELPTDELSTDEFESSLGTLATDALPLSDEDLPEDWDIFNSNGLWGPIDAALADFGGTDGQAADSPEVPASIDRAIYPGAEGATTSDFEGFTEDDLAFLAGLGSPT